MRRRANKAAVSVNFGTLCSPLLSSYIGNTDIKCDQRCILRAYHSDNIRSLRPKLSMVVNNSTTFNLQLPV